MTREDFILSAAMHVGLTFELPPTKLLEFAEIVASHEREQCAKLFDGTVWSYDYREIAAAIRARSKT
jgi:hypothetical protein